MPQIPSGARGAVITGWGRALPDKIVTNDDLSKTLDTNDEWIRERTGIHQRHIGGTTAGLSVQSARLAMQMAKVEPLEIDALVLATTTPDRAVPGTSPSVQHQLGLKCGAYDINAACSGFVYALINAHGLIAMGAKKYWSLAPTLFLASPTGPIVEQQFCLRMARAHACSKPLTGPDNCLRGI